MLSIDKCLPNNEEEKTLVEYGGWSYTSFIDIRM